MTIIKLTLASILLALAAGDGEINIKFKFYENPGGQKLHGDCCDHSWGKCVPGGCDHMFTICVDHTGKFDCSFGKIQSSAIQDRDEIIFGDTVGNLTNPVKVPVSGAMPGEIDVKVTVYDEDTGFRTSNDYVDQVKATVKPLGQVPKLYVAKHRTILEAEIWAVCAPGWKGANCGTRG